MDYLLEQILQWTFHLRDFMWGNWMIALLVMTGILLTIVTRFIQLRKLITSFRLVLLGARGKDYDSEEEGDISPFAALMTALAATVGEFAEILRKSYWAKGAKLDTVLERAQKLSDRFKDDADVIELVDMISKAKNLIKDSENVENGAGSVSDR